MKGMTMRNRKPRVTTKCPAETYSQSSLSRVVEFSNRNPDGHKCLVEVYRADPGVAVRCDPDLLDLSEADARRYVERVFPGLVKTLREIAEWAGEEEPEPEDYDDMESAYHNGGDVAAWERSVEARKALVAAGFMGGGTDAPDA
jgi:hypothetical protein